MAKLITFLSTASSIEKRVSNDISRLNNTMQLFRSKIDNEIPQVLDNANKSVVKAGECLTEGETTLQETLKLTNLTVRMLEESVWGQLNELRHLTDALTSVENKLKDLSSSATGDLSSTTSVVQKIRNDANKAKKDANDALVIAKDIVKRHNELKADLTKLEERTNTVIHESNSNFALTKKAKDEATDTERRALLAKNEADRISEILTDTKGLENRAASLNTRSNSVKSQSDSEKTKSAAIITRVAEANKEATKLKSDSEKRADSAKNILSKTMTSHKTANDAQKLENESFESAENMLDVMKNFGFKSSAIKKEADDALATVEKVQTQAEDATRVSKSIQTQLTPANTDSTVSLTISNEAKVIATKQKTDIKSTKNISEILSKQVDDLVPNAIPQANNVTKLNESHIAPSIEKTNGAQTQTENLINLSQQATDGVQNATVSTEKTDKTLNDIIKRLSTITHLDSAALDKLEKDVEASKVELGKLNLEDTIKMLKVAVDEQKIIINNMKKREQILSKRVNQIRDASDQLKRGTT